MKIVEIIKIPSNNDDISRVIAPINLGEIRRSSDGGYVQVINDRPVAHLEDDEIAVLLENDNECDLFFHRFLNKNEYKINKKGEK